MSSLAEIGPVVPEKKINVKSLQKSERQAIRKADFIFQLSWAKKHNNIYVRYLPVLELVDPLGVRLGELALAVEDSDGGAELRHRVEIVREVVQHGDHMVRQGGPLVPFL